MSFRATCGLSNLPIDKNDDVVVFLLKEKSVGDLRGGYFVNIDDLFTPISAPIYAKYDGYGSIMNINEKYKDLITCQVRNLFNRNIPGDSLSLKDNSSKIEIATASLEDMIYEFERGNVIQIANENTINLYKESGEFHRGYYFTGLTMFHKDIFEEFIALNANSDLHKESYGLAKNFEKIDFRKVLNEANFNKLITQVIYESRMPNSEYKNFDVYVYWYINSLDKTVNTELLDFIRNSLLISDIMSLLSKPWMPQVISVEEEKNKDAINKLNEIIKNKLTKKEQVKAGMKEIMAEPISEMDLDIMKSIAKRFNIDITQEFKTI